MIRGDLVRIIQGKYQILCTPNGLPAMYENYKNNAALFEEYDWGRNSKWQCFIAIGKVHEWPQLVVSIKYDLEGGLYPGVLLMPDTTIAFIGAGELILIYDVDEPRLIDVDRADAGFHTWEQHEDIVLLSAELEFAAWDTRGNKLWTTFVEPPWGYAINDKLITLDVMGEKTTFSIHQGPDRK